MIGGLTRLTKSGLSMVEWKVQGSALPADDAEWTVEFDKYKQFPEYDQVHSTMTLPDFKFIYLMEWSHRMAGRSAGLLFVLPLLYFGARGRLSRPLAARLALLFGMGAAQGAIGWWMVKSGLQALEDEHQHARVSPYRLTAHLVSAFTIYSLCFSTALKVWSGRLGSAATAQQIAVHPTCPRPLRVAALATTSVIFLTVVSGAFVAGNEAGLVYNEFPLMGGRLVPQDYINPYLHPRWRNMFENSSLVQFQHRALAMTTLGLVGALFVSVRRAAARGVVSVAARRAAHALIGMGGVQVTLGISTLLMLVPVPLASAHQAGSLTLLTISWYLVHALGRGVGTSAAAAAVATAAPASVMSMSLLLVLAVLSTAAADMVTDECGEDVIEEMEKNQCCDSECGAAC